MGKQALTKIPFAGTAEQKKQLLEVINSFKNLQGALMPVLQGAQNIYGYLPIEVQEIISDELSVPLEDIFGVVTFYSQFTLNPKGKFKIGVCLGTACYVKGAKDVYDEVSKVLGISGGEITADGEFSLDATRCIGCCGLAPVMTVNDDVYGKLTAAEVADIIKKYK